MALAAAATVALVLGYVMTMGDHAVPRTVVDDPSLPRVELNGTVFHANVFGDASRPVIIVVHGGPGGDHRALLALRALADRFHVVFYDQRGSGLSARAPAAELNLETFLDDLDAVVDHFGRGRAVDLIGHSWGGALVAAYVARHPNKVRRVVLAEPVPLTPDMARVSDVSYGASLTPRVLVAGVRFWLESLHVDRLDGHERGDYLFTRMAPRSNPEHHCGNRVSSPDTMLWRMGREALRGVRRSLLDEDGHQRSDLIAGIENYPDDILVLAGECSALLGPAFQARQTALFPAARMIVIGNAGHMMFTDQPEVSIAAIRTFLERGR